MAFLIEIICVLCACAVLFYFYVKQNRKYWSKRNVPTLKTSLIWGNIENPLTAKIGLNMTIKKAYDEFKRKGLMHGGVYVFFDPTYIPTDPELVKNILTKEFQHFSAHGHATDLKNDPLSGTLFRLDGDQWRDMRIKFSPTFTSGKMKFMYSTLSACAGPMVEHINELVKSGEPLNIKHIVSAFSMDVIGSCAFGVECNSFKNPNGEFRQQGLSLIYPTMKIRLATIFNFFIPSVSRWIYMRTTPKEMESFFVNLVESITGYRQVNNFKRNDFIQLFMDLSEKAKGSGEKPLTVNQIAAQSFVFFIAGFETSSATMTFALHELSHNQEVQDKLREELRETMKKHDGKLTYDDIMDLKYLDMVVKETLRKYPPVPIIGRQCTKDYKVPNTDLTIEEGTRIFISALGLHRDEEHYPNPLKFDPERFNEDNKSTRHPYTFLPFGEGPRICIGLRFGLMQTKTGLSSIISNFRVLPHKDEPYDIKFNPKAFILTKEGKIMLNVEKLDS